MHVRLVLLGMVLVCAPVSLSSQPAHLVKDMVTLPGAASANPGNFTRVGATIFFTASDSANGTELWKTDGTAAGTMLVRDILLGPDNAQPRCLQPYQGQLVFT